MEELETLLDGNYCVSRQGQTFALMSMRNHPSLDEEALEMSWQTITKMLWNEYGMGSRKYTFQNRWKRASKGLLHKERRDNARNPELTGCFGTT